MKKFSAVVILVLAAIMVALVVAPVQAGGPLEDDEVGWFIKFWIEGTGQDVTIGGADSGYGHSLANQNFSGVHIGLWDGGLYAGQTFYGSKTPYHAKIFVWSDVRTVETIHWRTMGTNYSQNLYYSRTYWPNQTPYSINFSGQGLDIPIGQFNESREGWISPDILPSDWQGGFLIEVDVNQQPIVPEPSSLLALGSGLLGLGGFVLRRRKG